MLFTGESPEKIPRIDSERQNPPTFNKPQMVSDEVALSCPQDFLAHTNELILHNIFAKSYLCKCQQTETMVFQS